MSVFDDMNRFLEERLEAFLRAHPHLELQVLEDKLQEQALEAARSLQQLQAQEEKQQQAILATAEDIQRWHERSKKAEQANRNDLVTAAQEREATLLRQGNQQWGHLEVIKERIQQLQSLQKKIALRQEEVKTKRRTMQDQQQAAAPSQQQQTASRMWSQPSFSDAPDPLEEQFRRWEMDEELEQLKRKMGR